MIDEKKYLNIVELFPAIQGEGKLAGVPSIFVRTVGCNLHCQFKDDICDTPYASEWWPELGKYTFRDIDKMLMKYSYIKHIVITGGEPFFNAGLLTELYEYFKYGGNHVTIETNGTRYVQGIEADLLSISPKLGNSVPKAGAVFLTPSGGRREVKMKEVVAHQTERLNYAVTKKLIKAAKDYQLKFVVSSKDQIVEIQDAIFAIGGDRDKVWLMPEGLNREQLASRRKEIFELALGFGYKYTDRLHVLVYGDKRGV